MSMVLVDEANLNELLEAVEYFETTAPFTAPFDKGKWLMMEQKLHHAREGVKPVQARGLIMACKHIAALRPGPVDTEDVRHVTERFSISHHVIDLVEDAIAPLQEGESHD